MRENVQRHFTETILFRLQHWKYYERYSYYFTFFDVTAEKYIEPMFGLEENIC